MSPSLILAESWADVLLLRDYNTRIVVLGTTILGIAAGVVGTFAYLRKRAMVGDALSHATLPGIALAFLLTSQKQLPVLLAGAALTGILGVLCVLALRRFPRIREDAAIGIVLSVFFGAGVVLMTILQKARTGNQAGLNRFIYGTSAGMIARDAELILLAAAAVVFCAALFYKELRIVCFDQDYAASLGRPVLLIDLVMMGLLVLTTVVGLQAVGLILVVALLIIPAAAARFWTEQLLPMILIAALVGAASGYVGSCLSARYPNTPTGAVIVLCAGGLFLVSMSFAPRRGVIADLLSRVALRRKIAYQNLLRALAEHEELSGEHVPASTEHLLRKRSWSRVHLRRLARRAERAEDVGLGPSGEIRLTPGGRVEAARILRNHRLWEMYLIKHADIAPSHVDRDADQVEHVLSREIVQELERAVEQERKMPPSPHVLEAT